ncbi:MAG: multidrug efflux MFS transporter [Sphingomonadales bacterium]|nr:multidrug efflux MFS transporter [Sphingomonadales bacterium]
MTAYAASAAGPNPSLATWAGFGAMCVGMFMAVLDIQVVATSLPTIQAALDMRPDQMSWIQTSYLIAEVVAIPLTGVLTRALGMRWLSIASLTVFTAASIGCAYSQSFAALIVWRVVQGLAGGLLIPRDRILAPLVLKIRFPYQRPENWAVFPGTTGLQRRSRRPRNACEQSSIGLP